MKEGFDFSKDVASIQAPTLSVARDADMFTSGTSWRSPSYAGADSATASAQNAARQVKQSSHVSATRSFPKE